MRAAHKTMRRTGRYLQIASVNAVDCWFLRAGPAAKCRIAEISSNYLPKLLRHNCHRPLTRITSRTTHTLEGNGNDVQQGSATRSAWTTKVKQSAPFPRRICGTNNWGSCAAALEWQRQQWRRSSCLPAVVRKRPRRIPARRHRTSQHQRPHYNDAVPEVSVPL